MDVSSYVLFFCEVLNTARENNLFAAVCENTATNKTAGLPFRLPTIDCTDCCRRFELCYGVGTRSSECDKEQGEHQRARSPVEIAFLVLTLALGSVISALKASKKPSVKPVTIVFGIVPAILIEVNGTVFPSGR